MGGRRSGMQSKVPSFSRSTVLRGGRVFSFSPAAQSAHFLPLFNPTPKRHYSTYNDTIEEEPIDVDKYSTPIITDAVEAPTDIPIIADAVQQVQTSTDISWYQYPIVWCESGLEAIHSGLNLPWWATIITAAFCVRALTFPLHIKSLQAGLDTQRGTAKIVEIKRDIVEKLRSGVFMSREHALHYEQQEIFGMYKRENINIFRPFGYSLAQAPIYTTLFFTLRNMSETHPEFANGGILWFTDLAARDPYYILPLILSATFITNMEIVQYFSRKYQILPYTPAQLMVKKVFRFMGLLIFPFMCFQPSAVLLYWTVNNFLTVLYTLAIRTPFVQKIFDFPPTVGLSVMNEVMPDTFNAEFVPMDFRPFNEVDPNLSVPFVNGKAQYTIEEVNELEETKVNEEQKEKKTNEEQEEKKAKDEQEEKKVNEQEEKKVDDEQEEKTPSDESEKKV